MSNAARSRMLGRLLMVVAVLQLLAFGAGVARRSYLAVALPVGGALAALSALAFWVGYTMAYARWDEDEAVPFEHAVPLAQPEPHEPPGAPTPAEPPAAPEVEPAPI